MVDPLNAARVHILPSADATDRALAARLFELASERRDRPFTVALSGGSTPEALFRLLATDYATQIRDAPLEFGFADERAVGPEDPRSNFGLAQRTLFAPLAVASGRIHRIEGEVRPIESARDRYEATLRSWLGPTGGPTAFDAVLLGVGPDGHTASLYPSAASLRARDRWVVEELHPATDPKVPRISLTLGAIAASGHALFLARGAEKRAILSKVFADPRRGTPEAVLPSARVQARESVEWFLDAEAAPPEASRLAR
jgi:6-phosphogluconolactonase